MKQKLTEIKDEVDNSTIIIGDINTTISIDRAGQKINKEIGDLNSTIFREYV